MTSPTVTVHANVEREVAPDSYEIWAQVSAAGGDVNAATSRLVATYTALQTVADTLANVEIRHTAMSVSPGRPKESKATAQRIMFVTSHDLAGIGAVADALAAVDGVALEGPHWQIDRDNSAYEELQADAVREARDRAARYATALGGTLARLVELRDPNAGGGIRMARAAARFESASRAGPEVSTLDLTPQSITLNASVEATWYLSLPD